MIARAQIIDFGRRLADEFRPHRIVLFGSHAYGTPHESSDVDLLVILPFRGDAFDLATQMLHRVRAPFAVDLLVRTPSDTLRRYHEFDPLIREALDRGKVIYERNGAGMGAQGRRRLQHRLPRIARPKVA